jgi:hypothetical protein
LTRTRLLVSRSQTTQCLAPIDGHVLCVLPSSITHRLPILLKCRPSGSALCCFERSNLPQHKRTRTAVIRIVKIISPVTCRYPDHNGPIPLPVQGELVQRYYQRKAFNHVHSVLILNNTWGCKCCFGTRVDTLCTRRAQRSRQVV